MARGAKGGSTKLGPSDWKKARRLYEVDGLSVTEIGQRLGCKRQTVSAHRDAEQWSRRTDVGREAAARAAEKLADRIASDTGPAILDNVETRERCRRKALFVTERLLDGLVEMVQPGADGSAPKLIFGMGASPDLTLRRCFLNLGGAADGEGSSGGEREGDSDAREAAVLAALAELDRDGPAGG